MDCTYFFTTKSFLTQKVHNVGVEQITKPSNGANSLRGPDSIPLLMK